MKKIIIITLLAMPSFLFAQVHFDFGFGATKSIVNYKTDKTVVPTFKASIGGKFNNNVVVEAIMNTSMVRSANSSWLIGAKLGYSIGNFIPSVGYLYNFRTYDTYGKNGFEFGYDLKYLIPVHDFGGFYVEALYTKSTIGLSTGIHIIL